MFIPNNDIKIVCRLEKDDGNTIKIKKIDNNYLHFYKAKITSLVSNISLDAGIFYPAVHYLNDVNGNQGNLHYHHSHGNGEYHCTTYLYGNGSGYVPKQLEETFLSYDSSKNMFCTESGGIIPENHCINPNSILTIDGKPLDITQYTGGKKLQFAQGAQIAGEMYAIDLHGYNGSKGAKIGTLPTKFIAIDQTTSQAQLLTWSNANNHIEASNLSDYFTIKYETGGIVGYISDSNGNPDPTLNNKFQLNISVLDFIQLAQIEEYEQKNLALEESHSVALSTAQVKGKAISTVVNRVKRQVEEDAKDEVVDEIKANVEQNAKDKVVKDVSNSVKSDATDRVINTIRSDDVIKAAAQKTSDTIVRTDKSNVISQAAGKIVLDQNYREEIISQSARNIAGWMELPRFEGERNQIMERSSTEVAKRINKRSVEDRAVRKVTDKIDAQDVVDKVDPDKVIEELIEAIGSNSAEQIIHGKIQGVNKNRFADKLVQEVGSNKAKEIVSGKITDLSLLIDKLLEKNPSAEQKIIGILTDPNNTELIIKAFAKKHPEVDIKSIIKNLQKPRAAKDFNVRNSLKQGQEAAQQAEIAQKSAENARDKAKVFANQAQSSEKEATSAKNASINSLHEIAQRYSSLNRDKSDTSRKAHRVKRSMVEENASEETPQILTMRDIRRLLKKNVSESVNRIKIGTKNMVDLSEEKTVKEIERINLQVTRMESEVNDIKTTSTQVKEAQQEIQERIQEIEQDIQQVGSDSLNIQRINRKVAQRAEDSRIKAEQSAEKAVDARDESQIFAEKSQNSASEAQESAEKAVDARDESQNFAENSSDSASEAQESAEKAVNARDESQNFAENSSDSASEAQESAEKAAQAIEKIEEEMKGIGQRIPQALAVNTAQEKKNKLKIIQSDDNLTEIEVEDKGVIGKFSKVGYYFHSGQLHIHNPETGVDIVVPSEFNLLKVVENSEMPTHYMLVLTNQLGNELFEYKKYDPAFSFLTDEFKSLDLQQIKTLSKINFQNGSYFILKPGAVSSQGYAVDVHEIASNKKIGTLADEFCYYQNGQFNYMNYHTGNEVHHPSSHEHYLSLNQKENYQAEASIVCGKSDEKIASDVNLIVNSEFGLLEYLADHNLI